MGIKIMKIYKDTFNNLWGYELDGSQDHLIPNDFIQITDEDAEELRQQALSDELTKNPPLPELTPQEKLANAGLSVDELKLLLGIA
jgi:hypothetical protein